MPHKKRLQTMRRASPTGGAMGQMSTLEAKRLQAMRKKSPTGGASGTTRTTRRRRK